MSDVALPDALRGAGDAIIKDEPRTVVWRARHEGAPAVLKLYRHRGMAATLGTCRARREYDALSRLVAARVACTVPIAWSRGRSVSHGRWELLITREIPAVLSLRVWLESGKRAPDTLDLVALFSTIGSMHASGVFHGALWSSNVLMDDERYYVSDMARAVVVGRGIRGGPLALSELLDFCYSLTSLGVAPGRLPLREAGLDPAAEDRFRTRLAVYRPGKRVRQTARARALVRRWSGPRGAGIE